jgi:hypothetical protein
MELKVQALLDRLITEGVRGALNRSDYVNVEDVDRVTYEVMESIWLELDTYFDFE